MTVQPIQSYEDKWRDYKRRNYLAVALYLGWIPFGCTVALTFNKLGLSENSCLFVIIPYMAGFAFSGWWISAFRCPKCNERFGVRGSGFLTYHNSFTRKCLNCGLPKYASTDPGPQQEREFEKNQPLIGIIFDSLYNILFVLTCLVGVLEGGLIVSGVKLDQSTAPLTIIPFSVILAADLLLSMVAVVTIRRRNLKNILSKEIPSWIRFFIPTFLIISFALGIHRMFWQNGVFHFPPKPPPAQSINANLLPTLWEELLSSCIGLMALYSARRIRKAALNILCTNGHRNPIKRSHCSTCGAPIDT